MELKPYVGCVRLLLLGLLIVPYGIETQLRLLVPNRSSIF